MQTQGVFEVDHFRGGRDLFEEMTRWLQSETESMTHSEVERAIRERGFELLRVMYQGWLDHRSLEERREAAGKLPEGGVKVRRLGRDVECDFGRVRLNRLGYKRPKQPTVFPLDRELNLPDEVYSLEVRQRVAFEAQRSSWDDVVSTVDRDSGSHVPKRQAQELAKRAAQDMEAFYQQNTEADNDGGSSTALEVASCDSTGVTMLAKGLRESTRKAAERARAEPTRADPMEPKKLRRHDKRMAIVTANWEQERQYRTAEDVLANLDRQPGVKKPRGPRPLNKRVCASVEKSQAQGISEMFDEIHRRDPQHKRATVVLVDGEEKQLEQVKQQAESHWRTLTIIVDLIHVIHYLWMAGHVLCCKEAERTETWVRESIKRLLTSPANQVAASIRREATMMNLSAALRKPVDKCCDYLLKYQDYLRYPEYLSAGFPIATGVIEGTCRHLVGDRMDITGARWDVPGAEAVLRLRAIRCSGDWDEYWTFHERREFDRNHAPMAA